MKHAYTSVLRTLIVFIGIGTLAFLLWEPHGEGVHAHDSFFEVYFNDAFLIYAYIASILFFTTLYQAFTLLGCLGEDKPSVQRSVYALQIIKYCAMTMPVFIIIGLVWLLQTESNDRPPLMGMASIATLISITIAIGAARFQKKLQTR